MLQYYMTWLRTQTWWPKREEGQDLAEYALLLGLIAVVLVLTIGLFKDAIVGVFNRVVDVLEGAGVEETTGGL